MSYKYICGSCGKEYLEESEAMLDGRMVCSNCGFCLFVVSDSNAEQIRLSDISRTQQKIFNFLQDYISSHNNVPTAERLKEEFKLKSVSTVYYHLKILRKEGYIAFQQHHLHTLKIIPDKSRENNVKLSEKQLNVLRAIQQYISENNSSPTTQEIQGLIGVSSIATTVYYLNKLQELDLISRERYKHKALRLTELGFKVLEAND